MEKKSKQEILKISNDMEPIEGTVEVDIPIDVLWECFTHANWWSKWNPCFLSAKNKNLILGEQLVWWFQPIRWWYFYKFPAKAKIVELEPQKKVTWEVVILPYFYARHTYHVKDLGNGRSSFGSWEKANGFTFRLIKRFWLAHFTFVKDKSLIGALNLEKVYKEEGELNEITLTKFKKTT